VQSCEPHDYVPAEARTRIPVWNPGVDDTQRLKAIHDPMREPRHGQNANRMWPPYGRCNERKRCQDFRERVIGPSVLEAEPHVDSCCNAKEGAKRCAPTAGRASGYQSSVENTPDCPGKDLREKCHSHPSIDAEHWVHLRGPRFPLPARTGVRCIP
jgi:hypothetical protein